MDKWKVLSSEYVIENRPYGSTRKDRCLLPNGMKIDAYVQEYPDWVNAVVLTKDKSMVLVRQYRHGSREFMLETPGGMVDEGEDAEAAIIREVAEETGYASQARPIRLGSFYPNPATSNNLVTTYLFLDAFPVEQQNLDATEEIDTRLIPFGEFGEMIKAGQVQQQFAAFGYYLAKEFLKL